MFVASVFLPWTCFAQGPPGVATKAPPFLGEPPRAPANLAAQPAGPRPLDQLLVGGFSVNNDSREEVRGFYDAIYPTSENVPINSTLSATLCFPGHNSAGFQAAELRRINWFRAMSGMPANIVLDPFDNWYAQQMATIISDNGALNHQPPPTWLCTGSLSTNESGGNQAIGVNGADAITAYMQDASTNDYGVGHRCWILYPPETVMGIGDAPAFRTNWSANLTWIFDPASFGARPATRHPYVSWPPEGFVPCQVVYPYWSFGVSNNADYSAATVSMTSNGVSVAVVVEPHLSGYGDNPLVWVPMGLDVTKPFFPFSGTDTVYSVTISNVNCSGSNLVYSYSVTVFDPAVPGPDYVPPALDGPAQALVGAPTVYGVTPPVNDHVTGYDFLVAQLASGDLADNAGNGLVNFTLAPQPNYTVVSTEPNGSAACFNLQHAGTNSSPQLFQLKEVLLPQTNTVFSFLSELGYATTDEVARVQVSTDGGANWKDLFTEPGQGSYETNFMLHSLSLSNCAGMPTLLRFNFDFQGGSYINGGSPIGWFFTDILITNSQAVTGQCTNSTVTNILSGDLVDSAQNGLANFTVTPPPYYYVITNPPAGLETSCFHLCHLDPTAQYLQFNEVLLPIADSTLEFNSLLGYATTDELARVQASTNYGVTWDDLFVEPGVNSPPAETSFNPHTISLAAYVGQATLLRFAYTLNNGDFWPYSSPVNGWDLEDIVLTNTLQQAISTIDTTNFTFTAAQPGTYLLQAQPVIFNGFPLPCGPIKQVTVVSDVAPSILMNTPLLTNRQVLLNFTVSGRAAGFHLLQATQLNGTWTTNSTATLTTNVPGTSYRFTVTNSPPARFYRVRTP